MKKLSAQDVDLFENGLVSHTKDIEQRNQKQFERILLSAKAVQSYSKTEMDLNSIADYFGKVNLNLFLESSCANRLITRY